MDASAIPAAMPTNSSTSRTAIARLATQPGRLPPRRGGGAYGRSGGEATLATPDPGRTNYAAEFAFRVRRNLHFGQ